jgi:lipoprotein-anchoring transpeptidase ErfK/SrfK
LIAEASVVRVLLAGLLLTLEALLGPALSRQLNWEAINNKTWERGALSTEALIKLQVWLSRAGASPGVIDGNFGTNTRRAIASYGELSGAQFSERVDEQLWLSLSQQSDEPVFITYKLRQSDVEGPYLDKLPDDFREMAALDRLGYTSAQEKVAERFHMSEALLQELNPGKEFDRAGTEIVVANVQRPALSGKIARLEIREEQVRAFNHEDRLVAIYPATIGSRERPSPTGEYKVTAVAENPTYHYDPALNLSNVDVQEKLVLPPGPNSPVGVVWISLSAKGYGIHGTPNPEAVGKSASHGCIRLTNWDALELAKHVSNDTTVIIAD